MTNEEIKDLTFEQAKDMIFEDKTIELMAGRENKFSHDSKKDIHESNKEHLSDSHEAACYVAKKFSELGFNIIATHGTHKKLTENGIEEKGTHKELMEKQGKADGHQTDADHLNQPVQA